MPRVIQLLASHQNYIPLSSDASQAAVSAFQEKRVSKGRCGSKRQREGATSTDQSLLKKPVIVVGPPRAAIISPINLGMDIGNLATHPTRQGLYTDRQGPFGSLHCIQRMIDQIWIWGVSKQHLVFLMPTLSGSAFFCMSQGALSLSKERHVDWQFSSFIEHSKHFTPQATLTHLHTHS